jgi:hypothetical protein
MKTSTFFTFLLFFILGCTQKQTEQLTEQEKEQIKKEIKATGDILISGWAALDADKALQFYSPEMVACMDSLLIDYKAYAKGWQGYTQSASSIKLTPIKDDYIVLTKDFVISTWVGKVEMLMKSGDKITYNPIRYTDIMKKVDGQWKAIFEQSSGIPMVQAAEKK